MHLHESSIEIETLAGPLDTNVSVPGSKSLTNRSLPVAALAEGESKIDGVLFSDDTAAMIEALRVLGIDLEVDATGDRVRVHGCAGRIPSAAADVDARASGTVGRFLPAIAALGRGEFTIDGTARLRERPMSPLIAALGQLGASIDSIGTRPAALPLKMTANGLAGGSAAMPGTESSQFISALLIAAPYMHDGLRLGIDGDLVSRPYVDMTVEVMKAFGVNVERDGYRRFVVAPGQKYTASAYAVEPDASAASYFFAAAAICGGRATVDGLGSNSLQGDLHFVDLLESMGARVVRDERHTTVIGTGSLHGIEADMADISDTVPTLAVTAAFCDSPTRISGVGFIRAKESDRIGDVVRELQRLGVGAVEEDDGMLITPGQMHPARIETYEDHRIAMAFSLAGLRIAGIEIADPGCVAKTFPKFFDVLDSLR